MRRRPPWWPADEPWPPEGSPWRRRRGRFVWRVLIFAALLFVGVPMLFGMLGWLAAHRFEGTPPFAGPPFDGPPPFVRLFGLLLVGLFVVGIVSALRALRGAAAPIAEMMAASGRLSGGDYTVRVRERGPGDVRALARAFNEMAARLAAHEQQRRNLLAEVTHELRTPLAVIQGNLEGLLDGVYPRDEAHLAPVLDEARVLSTLIEDLRTLALAETGTLPLHREPTDLPALVDDTVAAFRAQAASAGVALTASLPDLPALSVDPTRIRQVLANLLSNALQHTPAGGTVEVSAALEPRRGTDHVIVSVADTGRGIPGSDLPHIFDRFYKSTGSPGSGLGLAIARNLVTLHGGEIAAESVEGRGTTIRVALPVRGDI